MDHISHRVIGHGACLLHLFALAVLCCGCSKSLLDLHKAEDDKLSQMVEVNYLRWSREYWERMSKPGVKFDSESMRMIIHNINEAGLTGWCAGIDLVRGAEVSPEFRDMVAAILEEKAIRANSREKFIWLSTVAQVLRLPATDGELFTQSRRYGARARIIGTVGGDARSFAEHCLASTEFSHQAASIPLLIEAVTLGHEHREWALAQLERKMQTSEQAEHSFWVACMSALTGMIAPAPAHHGKNQ